MCPWGPNPSCGGTHMEPLLSQLQQMRGASQMCPGSSPRSHRLRRLMPTPSSLWHQDLQLLPPTQTQALGAPGVRVEVCLST